MEAAATKFNSLQKHVRWSFRGRRRRDVSGGGDISEAGNGTEFTLVTDLEAAAGFRCCVSLPP